jgi:hypothetical protein
MRAIGVDSMVGASVRGWEEGVCREGVHIAQLGFLETDYRGSSRDKRIPNHLAFIQIAKTTNIPDNTEKHLNELPMD